MPTIVILDASAEAADALLDRIMRRAPVVATPTTEAALDPEGKPSHHLLLLDAKPAGKLNHKDALAWAESVGGELPERFEAALLYANLKDQFETSDYYWTATQSSDAHAWFQHFVDGYQDYGYKSGEFFARAVRRLEI